jgi:hypothetical protein
MVTEPSDSFNRRHREFILSNFSIEKVAGLDRSIQM